MPPAQQIEEAVQAALLELDRALDAVVDKFKEVGRLVADGKLDQGVLVAKLLEFQARLQAGE